MLLKRNVPFLSRLGKRREQFQRQVLLPLLKRRFARPQDHGIDQVGQENLPTLRRPNGRQRGVDTRLP